ncbi:hypothetical protein U9M48_026341 [Paspalum notatum var. saurae]|uniref:Uncharacterized protein n=1 Tax=Paspalum notatum var. saurae TaxID=547442 RepID=A0AAQ3TX84_PASNO
MGCAFSSSSAAASPLRRPCAGVRVIHTNGYVEDFEGPGVVTVAHVTGRFHHSSSKPSNSKAASAPSPPRHVLCSAAHLLQPGRGPFRPDDALQPGTVYFMLPHSVFQAESSAVDLACLMNRLTALARKGCATAAPAPSPLEAFFAEHRRQREQEEQVQLQAAEKKAAEPCGRPAPWQPRLDRIDESIGRASMRSSASTRSACSDQASSAW